MDEISFVIFVLQHWFVNTFWQEEIIPFQKSFKIKVQICWNLLGILRLMFWWVKTWSACNKKWLLGKNYDYEILKPNMKYMFSYFYPYYFKCPFFTLQCSKKPTDIVTTLMTENRQIRVRPDLFRQKRAYSWTKPVIGPLIALVY